MDRKVVTLKRNWNISLFSSTWCGIMIFINTFYSVEKRHIYVIVNTALIFLAGNGQDAGDLAEPAGVLVLHLGQLLPVVVDVGLEDGGPAHDGV